jgi:hypothetical protein
MENSSGLCPLLFSLLCAFTMCINTHFLDSYDAINYKMYDYLNVPIRKTRTIPDDFKIKIQYPS